MKMSECEMLTSGRRKHNCLLATNRPSLRRFLFPLTWFSVIRNVHTQEIVFFFIFVWRGIFLILFVVLIERREIIFGCDAYWLPCDTQIRMLRVISIDFFMKRVYPYYGKNFVILNLKFWNEFRKINNMTGNFR